MPSTYQATLADDAVKPAATHRVAITRLDAADLTTDKGGKGSFDDVMRGWQCLTRHGVDVNIMCTVHAANGDHGRCRCGGAGATRARAARAFGQESDDADFHWRRWRHLDAGPARPGGGGAGRRC